MLSLVENVRRKHLNWVQAIMATRHWNPSQLASHADIDHSTLSKFLNDKTSTAQLSSRTIEKLALAGGMPPFQLVPAASPRGFAEAEATPYEAGPMDPMAVIIGHITAQSNTIDTWVLQSRALELAGYMPGDVLLVDLNAEPHNGDVVCVQIYDRSGRAETAFRIYEKPYIVAASIDPALRRPMLLDGDHVTARGVVIASLRPRQGTHKAA
jgi:transcriptional regulator with XRE-family HTH domain